MKNVKYGLFLGLLFLISCSKNEKNIKIFGYELGNNKIQNFKLNVNTTPNKVYFEYLHQRDTVKNIRFQYNPEEDYIIINLDTFNKHENSYQVEKEFYNLYQTKTSKSHKRTMVFNPKFGLLASLAYGKDILFLTDSISLVEKEFIYKDLFININNTEI